MSVKGRLLGALGPLVLRDARVTAVIALSDRLRRVEVEGGNLCGVGWTPGDKVQVVLPGYDVRTYTPTRWDPLRGTTSLVVFSHGSGPGSAWGREVRVGDPVRFVGPQSSVRGPGVVFGDETAFGVVEALGGPAVLEVGDADAAAAFAAVHPEVVLVPVEAGDRHLDRVADALVAAGGAPILVGRASSIQALRPRLVARGVRARPVVKPYWADGKTGLD